MRLAFFSLMILLCVVNVRALAAQAETCTLPARLVIGHEGRVLPDVVVNVRDTPGRSGLNIGRIPAGGMFSVLDGPRCADGYWWWQIAYHHVRDGLTGWSAEGDAGEAEYWLEPRGERVLLPDAQGSARYYLRLDDGTLEAEGCLAPPEDYARLWLGYAQVNRRTLFMLDHAEQLYVAQGGLVDFRSAITQGSYNAGIGASFGTHDGGGAVDLSVRSPADWSVRPDIEDLVYFLRVAGFAAWLRPEDMFYRDSPIHIHAIAVGDAELSDTARTQVEGEGGYLYGLDGIPAEYGGPNADAHGGPLICQWMRAQGLDDRRTASGTTAP
ncbi:MAG: SH3 domain-containing protein [Chloroflexi bacterium]|nr:SH3 domain-containing protein [Chloroflexota bacterium]